MRTHTEEILLKIRYSLAVLALAAAPLRGQYGPTQDSTLIGLRRVAINFAAPSTRDSTVLRDAFVLEIRKAGIRVATSAADSVDGIMNVLVGRRSVSNSCELRIDLEQNARLIRTSRAHRMVTWFYWDEGGVCRDSWFKDATTKAVNAFLTKWLDMNGR